MERFTSREIPPYPKLRPVEPHWVEHQGQHYLYLRDPLSLAEHSVLIPGPLVPLLALCDGTRDLQALQLGLALRTGIQLSPAQLQGVLAQLDAALLLENGSYRQALDQVLSQYRQAQCRKPSHAGLVYPEDPDRLRAFLGKFCARVSSNGPTPTGTLVGLVSPHIDYARGGKTYAAMWQKASPYLQDVELAIILGTDHAGGLGTLTPTRQSYATPLGVLPTERQIVDGLAQVLGEEAAFAEEFHHVKEHSIELAAVWFHYAIGGRRCPVVPLLCGSLHHHITGKSDPGQDDAIGAVVDFLKQATAGRRTLVIAAGDLAHVGPAFGDEAPVDALGRARLKAEDEQTIAAICCGDAAGFFELSRKEEDARRICGMSPIYLALRLLGGQVRGEALGYDQCPADAVGGSLVSIVGALLYQGQAGA